MKKLHVYFLVLISLWWSLSGCSDSTIFNGDRIEPTTTLVTAKPKISGSLSEVAPPVLIAQLEPSLSTYEPQIKIISPQPETIEPNTTIEIKLNLKDLPIYQDPNSKLGCHLRLILDDGPYQEIYSLEQPIVLENLSPGTHTIRVFAATPWGESFKNEGAYAQTTFHVLTKTAKNNPDPNLPLLTYNLPQGVYGAEPILLDFYLNNVSLHLVAQENIEDQIKDWRIKVTINGESFVLDAWQSIYLKGFKPGKNWVQLQFIDENGENIDNVYNNTVRLVDYDPNYQNSLANLVSGKISLEEAKKIVVPSASVITEPEIEELERSPEFRQEESSQIEPKESEQSPETFTEQKLPELEPVESIEDFQLEPIEETEIEPIPLNTEIEVPESLEEELETLETEQVQTEILPETLKAVESTEAQETEADVSSNSEIEPLETEINKTSTSAQLLPEIVSSEEAEISEIATPEIQPTVEFPIPQTESTEVLVKVKPSEVTVDTINSNNSKSDSKLSLSWIDQIKMWIKSLLFNIYYFNYF